MTLLRCSRRLVCSNVYRTHPSIALQSLALADLCRRRAFHGSTTFWGNRSQVLKDVGEGITEVQIIQWYVEEGAHVEEWKPLCQYQSDKAVDDITSRYAGVIKKLHFQADDTVPTGKALCDIEVDDAQYPDEGTPVLANAEPAEPEPSQTSPITEDLKLDTPKEILVEEEKPKSKYASLATPAVRGLLKDLNVNILDVTGTGKEGRVLKEDVQKFARSRDLASIVPVQQNTSSARPLVPAETKQTETIAPLNHMQSQMFKTMTKSLQIPHLLFTDELNIDAVTALRRKLSSDPSNTPKITSLSFIIKAVSLALEEYPTLNAKIDTSDPKKPMLVMRKNHNIGVAMDTPQGLIVPNIKNVAARSISDIAAEISRLSALGKEGKLTPADLSGGTITVSNIGNIGGTYVAPVIVSSEVAILGVGRSRVLPVFDDAGQVTKAELVNFSWSADHRVIDGATMARMANKVREFMESPDKMLLRLR
ncbi:putative biotin-dependent 2-oxo acid dehydrogenases acyltransferase [Talaromyces proteolyticus]|uniref:Dihydrolipoamide acetyltransferase component of pyruvate dehydrogenase complex n=1 Tax=Talaromyces proteolyticus TaxID=1131652 RepID=A0AAD4PYA6_9EURO|nr:putative biotin-dependent 2-oxo acid dehydrogenases acyltransferase [Talaromyces proteolyticus]KAH8697544.1 putative biotin-dependent 2-oxo acid dehydrogenases acyltransferase [Talaromyces proteolyticus]